VTRPLSPAFLITFAQALVDDDRTQVGADLPDPGESTASFIHHTGYWSHFDHRSGTSVWPLPCATSCETLARFAATNEVLVFDAPEPGDVYLLWSPSKYRFARAGIVISSLRPLTYPSGRRGYECLTIDACTSRSGSIRGPHTAVIQRALCPDAGDRLIRWSMLDAHCYELPDGGESQLRRAA
jgi:hypothetical protein